MSGEELLGWLLRGPSKEIEYLKVKTGNESKSCTENPDKLALKLKNVAPKIMKINASIVFLFTVNIVFS